MWTGRYRAIGRRIKCATPQSRCGTIGLRYRGLYACRVQMRPSVKAGRGGKRRVRARARSLCVWACTRAASNALLGTHAAPKKQQTTIKFLATEPDWTSRGRAGVVVVMVQNCRAPGARGGSASSLGGRRRKVKRPRTHHPAVPRRERNQHTRYTCMRLCQACVSVRHVPCAGQCLAGAKNVSSTVRRIA